MKAFYWQLKREFWEHRGGLLWTPLIVAGVFLVLNLLGILTAETLHHGTINFGGIDLMHLKPQDQADFSHAVGFALDMALAAPAILLTIVMGFVLFAYCLGALYNDRRDRSILFWKSLPLSDTGTVLSKLVTAVVVAPVIALVIGVVSGLLMILMLCITLGLHGLAPWSLLLQGHPLTTAFDLLALIPLYAVWALPTVGWLLMCSAFSRSRPFLLAVVVPIGVSMMLGWFRMIHVLDLSFLGVLKLLVVRLLTGVFPGGWMTRNDGLLMISHSVAGTTADAPRQLVNLGLNYAAFGRMDLWLGVLAGAIFVAIAIWCRRWRDEA
ncbi:hypothetical protein [Frateuria aurantia]|uniref:ABC-type transport system involved in multi-copper enzyme maturation, permease component n=1 Tax=Frateuria aurantia (strain ATCC 33424 / DSM 6220 / KCTC 2777 / LMG 1558 / NBRC 3245 / NCIMB 13370) TaxID=767434 RepID=H8L3A2_FRAAD|nr:hypothetical protein [Frateuria aurantia]AFC85538.1 hypothetical protein Fraau_1077 [Frateuria aurantia DSM 6220]